MNNSLIDAHPLANHEVFPKIEDKSNLILLILKLFLSKAERDYLLGKDQASHDYVCVKSRLNKKLKVFVDQELPLLLEKGYLSDIAEFRNIADFRNASNGLVAQAAERGLVVEKRDENKSPRWDLNPRPKVSAPSSRIMERGITKPSQ